MAAAAGLPLVEENKNPMLTTTFGVGELMRHALESGSTRLILALGGSATNDGGCGAAAALGTRFYDAAGAEFIPTGGTLGRIARIDNAATARLLAWRRGDRHVRHRQSHARRARGSVCLLARKRVRMRTWCARWMRSWLRWMKRSCASLAQALAISPGCGCRGRDGRGRDRFLWRAAESRHRDGAGHRSL